MAAMRSGGNLVRDRFGASFWYRIVCGDGHGIFGYSDSLLSGRFHCQIHGLALMVIVFLLLQCVVLLLSYVATHADGSGNNSGHYPPTDVGREKRDAVGTDKGVDKAAAFVHLE